MGFMLNARIFLQLFQKKLSPELLRCFLPLKGKEGLKVESEKEKCEKERMYFLLAIILFQECKIKIILHPGVLHRQKMFPEY